MCDIPGESPLNYHSASIRAPTKFAGAVVTRTKYNTSPPPSRRIQGGSEVFQCTFVARCQVALTMVISWHGGMERILSMVASTGGWDVSRDEA